MRDSMRMEEHIGINHSVWHRGLTGDSEARQSVAYDIEAELWMVRRDN